MSRILIVDDDQHILSSLRRSFNLTNYKVDICNAALEAIELMNETSYDMIITDMKMPKMDGYNLLKEVRERYPNIIRLILSGSTEEQIAFQALLEGLAKDYVYKPWDIETVLSIINNAFLLKEKFSEKEFLQINNCDILPFSDTYSSKILNLIKDGVDMDTLVEELSKDPVAVMKIFSIANSSFYEINGTSLKSCVKGLKLDRLEKIFTYFNSAKKNEYEAYKVLFIDKIMQSNSLCRAFLKDIAKTDKSAFEKLDINSIVILHSVGLLYMVYLYDEDYYDYFEKNRSDSSNYMHYEKEKFGMNYIEKGCYMLEWLNIPNNVIEVIKKYTIADTKLRDDKVSQALHIAAYYAQLLTLGKVTFELDPTAFSELALDRKELEAEFKKIHREMQDEEL